ncbi:long-chain-fatty-acid--CoA ligase [Mycobacterium sp. TJFP1]|nr:long-chain-fatty-acid--CoA ligase [Mycolicibacterium austroafricanum]QZY44590.1 long-chain-fatty-acid--CoA ligase [Mycolicibacterium austroafricanum]
MITGITLSDALARHAAVRPHACALADPRRHTTFGELDERVTRLASALAARGVRSGDRVAVLGLNSIELVESWLAAHRLGAIAVPVNFRLAAVEIGYVLSDSAATAIVVDVALESMVVQVRQQVPALHTVVTIGGNLEQTIAAADPDLPQCAVADDAPAFIMYTSGTTGFPKGAVLTHRNLYLHAFSSIATLGHRSDDDCWMAVAPLFHTAGVSGMLPMFLTGGKTVIPPSGGFDPDATIATVVDEQVTSCWMTPAQWQAVCALPGLAAHDLSRLRRVWWGAAPASTTLLRNMIDTFTGAEIIAAFGQTECSPITCLLRGEDAIAKIGSVGTPMLNVEVRVVDDEMNDVDRGEVGEIVYLGPLVMKEYWNKAAETAEAFRGGWFHSGDLVRQDADGYFYVVDRKKDMIISGGENIYSAEVENVVATHPLVAEVAVIGVPHPKWGETPVAVIVPREPTDPPTDAEIEAHCRAQLASYKRPKYVTLVDVLPRNAAGKVLKGRLRDEHATLISYSAGPTDAALLDETIGTNFERTVSRYPDNEALVDVPSGRRWTYAELNAEIDSLARALMAIGIEKGDRVGIWAPNCPEWTMLQYATAKIGAILVTINPAYRTHELAYVLRHSAVRLLVSATEFKTSDYRAMVAEVRPELPGLAEVLFLATEDWARLGERADLVSEDELRCRVRSLTPGDAINIQYTSGTTGSPKGATLSHRNILNNGYFVTDLIDFGPGDRLCIPVPFYHCFGMVMGNLGCTTHGATMVIPAAGFDPAATLAAIEKEHCTAVYGVPTMFIAMLGQPDLADCDVTSLRTGIMAGSPCPVEVMKRCVNELNMSEVGIAYGMTETSPVSCQTRIEDDLDRRTATVGRAHPHVEIKIVDPDTGEIVKRGTAGEFCTRGYSVMLGYWGDEDRTREAVDADGWMHTGDLAVMRDDGYCMIVGRIKDMVIRGGENVYPREIEEFLHTHPDIDDVQVIGVPDERYGEEICAWIKVRAGAAPLDARAVRDFAVGKLAHYKIPRYVHVTDDFPMTVTGKVRKIDMRAETVRILGL